MVDVKTFATFLDEKELQKDFGQKTQSVRVNLLKKINSIQTPLDRSISNLTTKQDDWLQKIIGNLPFTSDQISMINVPDEKLSKTFNTCDQEDLNLKLQWKSEVENEIFVYAGFIQPGKHQILVKDNRGRYFAREIVIDIRKRDIDPH